MHESNRRLEVTEKENKYFKDEVRYHIIKQHVTVNVLKFLNTFSRSQLNCCLSTRSGIHKMLVRIANSEDPDQTASEEAV